MVARPSLLPEFTGLRQAVFSLGKAVECWFAHYLSCEQIKLSMSKRERISQLVAELGGDDVDLGRTDVAKHPFYRAFFRCWNEQRYYEAHDVLEQLWLKTDADDGDFFKGLIQASGAFVHLQKRLSAFAPRHHGLDVGALCHLLRAYADQIIASDYKINPWSPETAPKLEL